MSAGSYPSPLRNTRPKTDKRHLTPLLLVLIMRGAGADGASRAVRQPIGPESGVPGRGTVSAARRARGDPLRPRDVVWPYLASESSLPMRPTPSSRSASLIAYDNRK